MTEGVTNMKSRIPNLRIKMKKTVNVFPSLQEKHGQSVTPPILLNPLAILWLMGKSWHCDHHFVSTLGDLVACW